MEKAKAFYCDTLGFDVLWAHTDRGGLPLQRVVGLPDASMDITMLEGYGMRIELFLYKHPRGQEYGVRRQCDFGLIHMALKVKDVRNMYAALLAKGVRFTAPPQEMRPGVIAAYMYDHEGNTIEIIENNVD